MDDCNIIELLQGALENPVQIPLWTIVTGDQEGLQHLIAQFRFLYGRL